MTRRPLTRVASAVVVAWLSVCTVGAQPSRAERDPGLVRPKVAPPSSDYTTYVEGGLVRVSVPSNWRELVGFNAVAFAPEGAYDDAGRFSHGLGMGLAHADTCDLRMTTDAFISTFARGGVAMRQAARYTGVTISRHPGLHVVWSNVSEATGEPERIDVFTTLLRDGSLFYVFGVAPSDGFQDYEGTFRRVVGLIQIMD